VRGVKVDSQLECGCCAGISAVTPQSLANPPGLAALAYRVGVHASFKSTMLALLTGPGDLARLTTRADDDPAIALIDAAAVLLDVLTFYQERIANEGFLRTATERMSILALARAIGYELNPGVAAGAFLAFELETAVGAPGQATIPVGTKVQSLPGQDEKAQTFETVEVLEARAAWNKIKPRLSRPQTLSATMPALWVSGVALNLKTGDLLLIAAPQNGGTQRALRRIASVLIDSAAQRTQLSLETTGVQTVASPSNAAGVWALRVKTAPFGHNAPLKPTINSSTGAITGYTEWPLTGENPTTLWLDAVYDQIQIGSWAVIAHANATPIFAKVTQIRTLSRAQYGLSARVTQLTLDTDWYADNDRCLSVVRDIAVFAQSETLTLANEPILEPLQGNQFSLDNLLPDLPVARTLIVSGKRVRVQVLQPVFWTPNDGSPPTLLAVGESLQVMQTPLPPPDNQWTLLDKNGVIGHVTASSAFAILPATATDALVSEVVTINNVTPGSDPTEIELETALLNSYDRGTVAIYANVVRATHGESRRETLGSGDASKPFQKFTLKQTPPLTYVSAATADGAESTLEVRVNSIRWQEVPTLYQRGPRERVYITRRGDDGKTTVQFGDGSNGARPPSGDENITATYRTGLGKEGMVKAGQLSLLITRPLGVQKVSNPLAPTGAADPESRDEARPNAPLNVLTLARIVARKDFEDFARAFAGIGKTQAVPLWDGEQRIVHVTIASSVGVNTSSGIDYNVDPGSDLYLNLRLAMDAARDPVQPIELAAYEPIFFRIKANVIIDPAYLPEKVLAAVTSALQAAYAFEVRTFGQPVHKSEVMALVQAVEGVQAVHLLELHCKGQPPSLQAHLAARQATRANNLTQLAQLLLLDPAGLALAEVPQ